MDKAKYVCVSLKYQFLKLIYDPKKVKELFTICCKYVKETIPNSKYIDGWSYGSNGGDSLLEVHELDFKFFSWELGSNGHLFVVEVLCDDILNNDSDFKKKTKIIESKIRLLLRNHDENYDTKCNLIS